MTSRGRGWAGWGARAARWRAPVRTALIVSVTLAAWVAQAGAASAATPMVSAGADFTCAINASSHAVCWGRDDHGELGDGTDTAGLRETPVAVTGLPAIKAISAGLHHACAIDKTGVAWCWGLNNDGQLGDGTFTHRATPVKVDTSLRFSAISAGGDFTCAITTNKVPYCWGDNSFGELGDNSTASSSSLPVAVLGQGLPALAIAAGGGDHACMLTSINSVVCWGNNAHGEVGDGTTTNRLYPVTVSGLTGGVASIAAGRYHSCALMMSGTMMCWGRNEYGQLGDGTRIQRTTPVPVSGIVGVPQQISAGGDHTCAVAQNAGSEIECWGNGVAGQLGDGMVVAHVSVHPIAVFGLHGSGAGTDSGPVSVSAGWSHTCAVIATGWIDCWGLNSHGDIGDGTLTARAVPTPVLGFTAGPQAVSEGGDTGCALTHLLHLSCWGFAAGNEFTPHDTAMPVASITGQVDRVSAGGRAMYGFGASCALLATAALECWGDNGHGEVGDGTMTATGTPVPVKTLNGTKVAVGDLSTSSEAVSCALSTQHGAYCWGRGGDGQLGDGANSDEDAPVSVQNIYPVSQISAGGTSSCALVGFGPTAYCWGDNFHGALGDGTTNDSNKPVKVVGLPLAPVQIATSINTNCAVIVTGVVYCWGRNDFGQVGNGTTTDQDSPVEVSLPAQAQEVVAGANHTCALLDDGTVYCWGLNSDGQLGDGTSGGRSSTPLQVTGLVGPVVALSSEGGDSTCALISSPSEVQCWGDNSQDELGNGTSGGAFNTPQVVQGL